MCTQSHPITIVNLLIPLPRAGTDSIIRVLPNGPIHLLPRGGTDLIIRVLNVADRSTRYRAVVLTLSYILGKLFYVFSPFGLRQLTELTSLKRSEDQFPHTRNDNKL
jgi:hypothetical protein